MSPRGLLACGAAAGPLYIITGLLQVLFRPGFDPRRHALSLMSNGDLGWIQIANFIVSGALVIAGAVGARRVLHPGRAGTSGPILLGLYGLGLIGAGIFVADPMDGFPLGTPLGPPEVITRAGMLHFGSGGVGFFALIAACLVFARRFSSAGERGWAGFSAATGLLFLAGFMAIASGKQAASVVLGFTAVVVLSWVWISALLVRLRG